MNFINISEDKFMLQEDLNKIINKFAGINEDYEMTIEKPEEDNSARNNKRKLIRDAIKPQVDIALSVIQSIQTAFNDNCDQSKKIGDMEEQIRSWEQQLHGACDQIIKTIEAKDGSIEKPDSIVNNSSACSPRAFNKYIKNNTSRDYSSLNLAAAIIIFYNSLA